MLSAFNPPLISIPTGANASSSIILNVSSNSSMGADVVIFYANNGTVSHATSIILMITNSTSNPTKGTQCLIAAATFGSVMSPEVQRLRNFRDQVMQSTAGTGFLVVFNAWYYSFSPYVANYLAGHALAREATRAILFPLIGILYLASTTYATLSTNSELATIVSGLLACSLFGAFYLGIPISLVVRTFGKSSRLCLILLMSGLFGILIGKTLTLPPIMMLATSITALASMTLSALGIATALTRLNPKRVFRICKHSSKYLLNGSGAFGKSDEFYP